MSGWKVGWAEMWAVGRGGGGRGRGLRCCTRSPAAARSKHQRPSADLSHSTLLKHLNHLNIQILTHNLYYKYFDPRTGLLETWTRRETLHCKAPYLAVCFGVRVEVLDLWSDACSMQRGFVDWEVLQTVHLLRCENLFRCSRKNMLL